MPRPPVKRRRQNSFHSSPRRRSPSFPDPAQSREILEKKLSHKPVGKRSGDSDDSDEVVTSRASGRNRKRTEIFASGAVAKGDRPGGYPTRSQRTRHMREDTEEILSQRSRSVSRASSVVSTRSTSASDRATVVQKTDVMLSRLSTKKRKPIAEVPTKAASKQGALNINGEVHPPAPVSVLGQIKPRKRQASILQIIENEGGNDSTMMTIDDEIDFLPDEVSTPVARVSNSTFPLVNGDRPSLKRKRGHEAIDPNTNIGSTSLSSVHTQPELPEPTRSQQRKMSSTSRPKDLDVMAPPESSDDDSDERARQPVILENAKKKIDLLTTEQLQGLMPVKKQKSLRQRWPQSEFDIPEDTTEQGNTATEDEHEHSTFLPTKSRKAPKRPRVKKANTTPKKARTKSKMRDKSKSTITPPSVRLRTPLPLSSTKRGYQAKSPSKQDTATNTPLRDKSTNTPIMTREARGGRKLYGGYRRQRAGKENHVISLSDKQYGENDRNSPAKGGSQDIHGDAPEVKAWNKKWADIDNFDLEFEEVLVSQSSDSMAR